MISLKKKKKTLNILFSRENGAPSRIRVIQNQAVHCWCVRIRWHLRLYTERFRKKKRGTEREKEGGLRFKFLHTDLLDFSGHG